MAGRSIRHEAGKLGVSATSSFPKIRAYVKRQSVLSANGEVLRRFSAPSGGFSRTRREIEVGVVQWLLFPVAVLAGTLMVVQSGCNGMLEKIIDCPVMVGVVSRMDHIGHG